MKNRFAVFAFALLLAACNNATHHIETATGDVKELTKNDLYKAEVVTAFLTEHPEDDAVAKTGFTDGITAYRKQNNIAVAQTLFMQSILRHPTAQAYFELANTDMDTKDYLTATLAYGMAEQLGYEPHANVLYSLARAYSRAGNTDAAKKYLEYAVEAGYNNKEQILKDKDLEPLRSKKQEFSATYQEAQSGKEKTQDAAFHAYMRGYPELQLPFTINEHTSESLMPADKNGDYAYISYDEEKYVPEMKDQPRFSREVGKVFFYVGKVAGNETYTAAVYAIENSMLGSDAPWAFMLTTYNNQGKIIDRMSAGQPDVKNPFRMLKINPGLLIEVRDYQQKWEKDPEENGYYENKIVSSSLLRTTQYHIAADGRIVRDNAAIGMK